MKSLNLFQLIGESTVDIGNDKVILTPSKTLKDLYVGEYKILLKLRALKALARKESAQALYTFIEALPPNPIPVSIERFRKRLSPHFQTCSSEFNGKKST